MDKVGNFIRNKAYITMLLLFACFMFYYFLTLRGLFHVWSTNDDYSYGYLIPVISGYLIWERRKQIDETIVSPNWFGLIPFLLFLLISLYGVLGSSPSAVQPTIPLILLSVVFLCFGYDMFKVLLFPLAFLIFMVPLPTLVQNEIGLPLKLLSTAFGELILRTAGVSVFVEGNVIDLGITQLQVVDACAGLRFILPLLALGCIFAHFFEKFWWKQAVLVIATIPLAVITNGIRIGITGILSSHYGSEAAMGFFHSFSGWVVFMSAFVLLFIFHFFLLKHVHVQERAPMSPIPDKVNDNRSASTTYSPGKYLPIVICSAAFILFGILSYSTGALPDVNIRGGMSSFPLAINKWQGKLEHMDPEIIRLSGAQEALNASYAIPGEGTVDLYIGYRNSPFVESQNFFHSPEVCLPSAGWNTKLSDTHTIKNVSFFDVLTVSRMVIEKSGQKQLVYYWFQTKNRVSRGVHINRFHLALDAIKRDNTYDLFVRPITTIYPDETLEKAQKRMDNFVREMMPVLLQFLQEKQYTDK